MGTLDFEAKMFLLPEFFASSIFRRLTFYFGATCLALIGVPAQCMQAEGFTGNAWQKNPGVLEGILHVQWLGTSRDT